MNKSICYLLMCLKISEGLVNVVDSDHVPHSIPYDLGLHCFITKTRLFKYMEKFHLQKNRNFLDKNSDIFHISAQNIDCGYSLELPR